MGEFADMAIEQGMFAAMDNDRYPFDPEDDDEGYYVRGGGGRRKETSYVDITIVSIKRETDKAWLIETISKGDQWYPKSQCALIENNKKLHVPTWLENRKLYKDVE